MSEPSKPPPSPSASPAEVAKQDAVLQDRLRLIRHRLIVLSGKGGVGKSTVAANLAWALAQTARTVGLLDVDVHGPSIPKLMGLEGARPDMDAAGIRPINFAPDLKVMSLGFLLETAQDAVIWRGPLKYNVIRQFLRDVNWGPLDYLIVDSPPGTGDEPLSVVQLVGQPAKAIVVTTPQSVAVADVRRSITFCKQLSLPVAGLIENMSGFVCPHCGKVTDLFKAGGGEALAHEMQVPFLGRVPLMPEVVVASDEGTPFLQRYAGTPLAASFTRIVEQIQKAEAAPSAAQA
ncbi:MAG: Mrp/NBP35 family ATP-binding protein [Verrucomicrobia bacterium]|nr:Mrp/NBP35 family ATP-binding protein [Verrucomicrobiota bacterium]